MRSCFVRHKDARAFTFGVAAGSSSSNVVAAAAGRSTTTRSVGEKGMAASSSGLSKLSFRAGFPRRLLCARPFLFERALLLCGCFLLLPRAYLIRFLFLDNVFFPSSFLSLCFFQSVRAVWLASSSLSSSPKCSLQQKISVGFFPIAQQLHLFLAQFFKLRFYLLWLSHLIKLMMMGIFNVPLFPPCTMFGGGG